MNCYGCNSLLPEGEKVQRRPVHNGQQHLVAEPHCGPCAKEWDERDRKFGAMLIVALIVGGLVAYRYFL